MSEQTIKEVIDRLKENGGGVLTIVVAKDSEFIKTVYLEAKMNNKSDVRNILTEIPESFLAFFNEDLSVRR